MKEKHHFRLPPIGMRVFKTLLSVLLVTLTYDYLLGGRNACFACIGAVYAIGNHFHEGFKFGFNRFVGTLFGGLIVIPFYWLYYNQPLGIPKEGKKYSVRGFASYPIFLEGKIIGDSNQMVKLKFLGNKRKNKALLSYYQKHLKPLAITKESLDQKKPASTGEYVYSFCAFG